MNNMNENFDIFDEYAMKFNFEEDAIRRKYEHSYRVMRESDAIVYSLGLEEDDSFIASIIGLFHDLGRFEQWTKYKTFDDSKSIDHALLSAKLLFEDNYVKKTNLEEKDYNVVKVAIENHSRYEIEGKLSEQELLHSKIIRDADKIDILYQFSNPKILELKNDDSEISKKIKDDFYNHKCIKYIDIKTVNDRVISVISLVFDLNFDYSKNTILEKEYLERLLEFLENKELFKPYINEAINFLKGSDK